MKQEFPILEQFFGGYFHQDWDLEGESDTIIIELFLDQEPSHSISAVISELDELIRSFANNRLDASKVLSDLGCYYYYTADGLSGLDWLIRIRAQLSRTDL